jgi:hypothetical protein
MLADSSVKRTIVDGYKTLEVSPTIAKSKAKRTLSDGTPGQKRHLEPFIRSKSSTLRTQSSLSDRNILNYKAAMFARTTKARIGSTIPVTEVKVGLIGSQGRFGQAVQGVGSAVLPGDMSEIRSPIRSRIYAALTPGGGGGRRIPGRNERGYRCPFGFQYGGRFTDRNYSTCGAQLFELPTSGGLGQGLGGRRPSIAPANAEAVSRVIQGNTAQSRAIQITRMAQVPRSGAENPKVRSAALSKIITTLTGSPSGESRLIRKDGVILRPVVPSSVLRNFGGNPDMENGVFVRSIDKPSDIIGDDLALLSGPAIMNVSYVAPNGSVISIERQRPLTVGERRKFGRQLNAVAGASDKYDVGNNIRDFANNSGGAFKYTEKFPNVDKPLDLIEVEDDKGKKIQVRRWVYETFMKDGSRSNNKTKPAKETETLREDGAKANDTVDNIADAVKMLDNGGDPLDLPPNLIADALRRSKKYDAKKLGTGVIEYSDGEGKVYYQVPESLKNGAIAERFYADVASQVGINTPGARLIGKEGSRESILADATNGSVRSDSDLTLEKADPKELMKVFVSDFLTDARDRSPATLRPVRTQSGNSIVPSSNELSALAGLDAEEIKKRFNLDLPDYLEGRNGMIYRDSFGRMTAKQRTDATSVYDTLIERAKKFNWSEYASRISADGNLSIAEQKHLDILKRLYETRLNKLTSRKKEALRLLGI